jgi:DNA-binding transcriptional LysR family regulator
LANRFLPKIIGQYCRANPKVKVDLILTERVVDLIGEGFDLALRIGELKDSTLIARKVGVVEGYVYASPSYIKKFGEPVACGDLKKHECILFRSSDKKDIWNFKGPRSEKSVEVTGKISTNDMSLVKEFALNGDGVAILPYYLVQDEVKSGKLKPLLKEWVALSQPIHVVYPGSRYLLPKVRTFLDTLFTCLKEVKWKD